MTGIWKERSRTEGRLSCSGADRDPRSATASRGDAEQPRQLVAAQRETESRSRARRGNDGRARRETGSVLRGASSAWYREAGPDPGATAVRASALLRPGRAPALGVDRLRADLVGFWRQHVRRGISAPLSQRSSGTSRLAAFWRPVAARSVAPGRATSRSPLIALSGRSRRSRRAAAKGRDAPDAFPNSLPKSGP